MMKKLLILSCCALTLTGCDFMQNHVGKYMPVIGKPCDNWQCFTDSGQAEGDAKRRMREESGKSSRTPLNGSMNSQGQGFPSPPHAPVTQTPSPPPAAAKSTTPFDMTPEQLGEVPNPTPDE